MVKVFSSAWYYRLLLLFLLWLCVVGSVARLWPGGIRFFTTTSSSSMVPSIYPGSLIITQEQPLDGYAPGDIVSFYAQPVSGSRTNIVTHRIIRMGGNVYLTKGDANNAADPAILEPRFIIGKVLCTIPWIGNVVGFAKTNRGMYLSIIIPAGVFAVIELKRIALLIQRG
ncbi:MAG: signal peptidase I [Candidatus Roizmanbacteria bacterium]|nr:signal peptidase I [Candidatus Roizmanbacteria bacterium]